MFRQTTAAPAVYPLPGRDTPRRPTGCGHLIKPLVLSLTGKTVGNRSSQTFSRIAPSIGRRGQTPRVVAQRHPRQWLELPDAQHIGKMDSNTNFCLRNLIEEILPSKRGTAPHPLRVLLDRRYRRLRTREPLYMALECFRPPASGTTNVASWDTFHHAFYRVLDQEPSAVPSCDKEDKINLKQK